MPQPRKEPQMARSKSEFLSAFGTAFQIFKAVSDEVLNLGGNDEHVRQILTNKGLAQQLAKLIVSSQGIFSRDMRKEGWTLLEDVTVPEQISISGLEIFSFLKEGEDHISGEEMRSRAKDMGANLGQKHAEYLLEHQADIPKDWRSFYLVFSGTCWRYPDGDLIVPCLGWSGGRWCLCFLWLGDGWGSNDRFFLPL